MASGHEAKLVKQLSGFPQKAGNRIWQIWTVKGADDYDTGGNVIELPAGINFVEEVNCSVAKIPAGASYLVFAKLSPVPSPTAPARQAGFTTLTLLFIDVATGVEPADNTDLSLAVFTISFRGRR